MIYSANPNYVTMIEFYAKIRTFFIYKELCKVDFSGNKFHFIANIYVWAA